MSDVENTDRPCPVHPRCSAAAGTPQVQPDPDRSADACDQAVTAWCKLFNAMKAEGPIKPEIDRLLAAVADSIVKMKTA